MEQTKKIAAFFMFVVAIALSAAFVLAAAVNDTAPTAEDTPVNIPVLGNDGGATTVASVTNPSNGVVVITNSTSVTYTPNQNFNGTDSFTYTNSDTNQNTATVMVTVTAVNDAPAATADSVTAFAGILTSINVLSNDNDVEGNTLTIQSVTTPANGAAVISVNVINYTANSAFEGQDTFSYMVSDGTSVVGPVAVTVNVNQIFSIESFDVNGDNNGDLSLEDVNDIEVEIQNQYTQDLDNVVVTVTILDVDGDDIDEEVELDDELGAGDEETVEVEFDLSGEKIDEDEYVIEVTVEGEDNNNNVYTTTEQFTVDVDRERHKVIITKAAVQSTTLQCSAPQTSLAVTIENIGKNDEDDVELKVSNSALSIDLSKSNIDLDDFSGSDNDYKTNFALDLSDAKAGRHVFNVEVFRDGTLDDSKEVSVQLVGCGTEADDDEDADKEAIENLKGQLQEGLQGRQEQSMEGSLRSSNTYTLLLGFLVVLTFVAIVLALAVLTVKGKNK